MLKTVVLKFAPATLFIFLLFISTTAQTGRGAGRSSSLSPVDIIISGGTIVTMDGSHRIIENGAIAIRNGEIVRIGKATELAGTRAKQTINAAGKIYFVSHSLRSKSSAIPRNSDIGT